MSPQVALSCPTPVPRPPPPPAQGYLIPKFHKNYWIGLNKASSSASNFTWFDPYVIYQNSGVDYSNWGTYSDGSGSSSPEPNNLKSPELCAVANWTEAYGGAWGWADTRCSTNYTFICKIIRERGAAGAAAAAAAAAAAVAL